MSWYSSIPPADFTLSRLASDDYFPAPPYSPNSALEHPASTESTSNIVATMSKEERKRLQNKKKKLRKMAKKAQMEETGAGE
jgi:hypothetical protein